VALAVQRSDEHRDGRWSLPIGLDARTLEPAVLRLTEPAGGLILGDAGTGKSTVLANIARCALSADAGVDIHAIASTWSPLLLLPGSRARRHWPGSTSGRRSSS
jgi:predicted ATPase